MTKSFFRACSFAFLFIVSLAIFASAQAPVQKNFSNIKIKNFGQMDERFYRGGQPRKDDYKSLADLGVKTIIDLRNDPEDYEKSSAEAVGIKYINIPMSDTEYPEQKSVDAFLSAVNDPATGVFFVHCAGGRHRTGVMGAVYRFTKYNWDFDQTYSEMKNYDFYTRWGHGDMKDFVVDYAKKFKQHNADTTTVTVAAGTK
jgi:protein tyrosine/serine phosphatase